MNIEIVKFVLALIVVFASVTVCMLYFMGRVTVPAEGGVVMGYLLSEAKTILASYFKGAV